MRLFCNMHLKTALLCLLLLNTYAINAATNVEQILWLQSATPPFHIEKSEQDPLGGLCDNLVDQLIENLPSIKHSRAVIPQKRIGKYMDEGQPACFPCMIYKEQATTRATFSVPTAIYPAFGIITTKNNAKKITQRHGEPVNLISLLTDRRFIYGKSEARKFTDILNQITFNTKSSERTSFSTSSDNETNVVIDRLDHDYIDYTIDYPFIADYFKNEYKSVTALAIDNQQEQWVFGAVGCSTSAPNNFAKHVIKKVNHVLKNKVLNSQQYQKSQEKWLKPSIENFSKRYEQYILNQPATDELLITPRHDKAGQ